jgi:hypothetical protein
VARRRRHSIDLLPLLDVFMVVLFVFATIQEQKLEDTTHDAEQLAERAAEAERALASASARDRERTADDEREAAALAEAERAADALRDELRSLREGVADEQARTRATLAQAGLPVETLERLDLLSRLLDKHGVVEIEIAGHQGEDGLPINRCCFRVDPLADRWQACGRVPALAEDRERWLDDGAHGLAEALRRTKGGNAMTLVRNDSEATHDIAGRLAALLRTRFSDQYVDAKEVPVLTARCRE